jgi:hypothetical protein
VTADGAIVGTESVVEAGPRNVDASLQRALGVGDGSGGSGADGDG